MAPSVLIRMTSNVMIAVIVLRQANQRFCATEKWIYAIQEESIQSTEDPVRGILAGITRLQLVAIENETDKAVVFSNSGRISE